MLAGRGVQGLCVVPRSSYAGASFSDLWGSRDLRHGRPFYAASLAVHTSFCQENRGLVAGTV